MDANRLIFLLSSWGLMAYGLRYILMSKDRLKGKTVKEENKKKFLVLGVISIIIGFIVFILFLIITFG